MLFTSSYFNSLLYIQTDSSTNKGMCCHPNFNLPSPYTKTTVLNPRSYTVYPPANSKNYPEVSNLKTLSQVMLIINMQYGGELFHTHAVYVYLE